MFFINKYNQGENYRTITYSDNVFHDALNYVKDGEVNFHIIKNNGKNFDLNYQKNKEFQFSSKDFPDAPLFIENDIFPDYLFYDETNIDRIYMGIFDGFTDIYFDSINEYTVVITKLLIKLTDKKIHVNDKIIENFLNKDELIKINFVNCFEDVKSTKLMHVQRDFVFNTLVGRYETIDYVSLFHNLFVLQYVNSLSDKSIKRLVVNISKTEGIGSILNNFFRIKYVLNKYGIEVYLKSNCTRYSDELLRKYFKISIEEENPENIYLDSVFTLAFTCIVLSQKYVLDAKILNDEFYKNLQEYKQAILNDKRVLGVLVRGTDYVASNMPIRSLPIEELIPLIEKTKEEGKFDYIFLATEDKDYYDALTSHFKGQIHAVSQMRFSARDLREFSFLSNLEKNMAKDEEYVNIAEDNLSNYFYAIYLLSECQGFIGMPAECNGVVMTKEFNKNKFEIFKAITKNI